MQFSLFPPENQGSLGYRFNTRLGRCFQSYMTLPQYHKMKRGPVVITEDDVDDKDILEGILKELRIPNKLVWFTNSEDAFHYLKTTTDIPFIIFSDINLPGHNGIDFKRRIDEDEELRRKSI